MRNRVRIAAVSVALVIIGSAAPTAAMAAPPAGQEVLVTDLLNELRVEAPSGPAYNRDLFVEGQDLDGDGCRTRQEVLIEESQIPAVVAEGCDVVSGQWLSAYDNVLHVDPAAVEMDHLVALKEAWVSGAWTWTDAQRTAFSNDIGDARSLRMVTAAVNTAKSDKDPAGWLPTASLPAVRCTYVSDWVAVKWRWNLSIDEAEKSAVQNVLAGCGSQPAVVPALPDDRPATPASPTDYYITKYDGTIWAVTGTSITALTFAQWKAAGTPTPRPAPTSYVKYAWSPPSAPSRSSAPTGRAGSGST